MKKNKQTINDPYDFKIVLFTLDFCCFWLGLHSFVSFNSIFSPFSNFVLFFNISNKGEQGNAPIKSHHDFLKGRENKRVKLVLVFLLIA